MPVSIGQPTQTVVLTTANQQGQGSVLSLPIGMPAQFLQTKTS